MLPFRRHAFVFETVIEPCQKYNRCTGIHEGTTCCCKTVPTIFRCAVPLCSEALVFLFLFFRRTTTKYTGKLSKTLRVQLSLSLVRTSDYWGLLQSSGVDDYTTDWARCKFPLVTSWHPKYQRFFFLLFNQILLLSLSLLSFC